jgi:hypothetical protein
MKAIKSRFQNFVQENSELTSIKNIQGELTTSSTKFNDYLLFLGESKKFEKDLSAGVEKELKKQGFQGANYLYDDNGNIRSEKQYMAILRKNEPQLFERKKREEAIAKSGEQSMANVEYGYGTLSKDYEGFGIGSKYQNNYQQMIGAARQIVTDPKVVTNITGRKSVPGLEKISDGTGTFGKAQFTVVNPRSSFGTYHYGQVLNNIRSQDLGANNVTLSIGGIDKTGAANKLTDDTTRAILAELQRSMDAAPKGFNFRMGVAPIAMNNANKSAYIFQLPPELIKKITGKVNDDGGIEGGLISPGQAAALQRNGLSVIMDRKAFNSDMYNSMFADPLAAYVDRDNTYNWSDPVDSRYSMKISKSSIGGDGSYQMDSSIPVFDTETNTWVIANYSTIADNAKQNLSDLRDLTIGGFNQAKEVNNQRVNGY